MKNNKNIININNDKVFNEIKSLIPESIVMNASAFMNKDAVTKTIQNVFTKTQNDYSRLHPNIKCNWDEYSNYIIEIIQMRIFIK